MNNPQGVSPNKGKQGTTRGKEKHLSNLEAQMNQATIANKQLVGKYRDVFNKHAEGAD